MSRRRHSKLRFSSGGRWYLALTLTIGLAAMASGNNALYLVESLLLAIILVSGVLSERAVWALQVRVRRGPAIAGKRCPDWIEVTNPKPFPVFCVAIGEWNEGRTSPMAYIARIGGRSSVTVPSEQVIPDRGVRRWSGVTVSTSYPFDLAEKSRLIRSAGERIVWPEPVKRARSQHQAALPDPSESEIRPYHHGDDCRWILWTLSSKEETPLVRARTGRKVQPRLVLDARGDARGIAGRQLEERISEVATALYARDSAEQSPGEALLTLLVDGPDRTNLRKIFRDKVKALNELAVIGSQEGRE